MSKSALLLLFFFPSLDQSMHPRAGDPRTSCTSLHAQCDSRAASSCAAGSAGALWWCGICGSHAGSVRLSFHFVACWSRHGPLERRPAHFAHPPPGCKLTHPQPFTRAFNVPPHQIKKVRDFFAAGCKYVGPWKATHAESFLPQVLPSYLIPKKYFTS